MILYTTYFKQSFHAGLLSRAGVFQLSVYFIMIFAPFIMGFATHNFWIKEDAYFVQPDIHFKHELILVTQGSTPHSELAWSTYSEYNKMLQKMLRVPVIKSHEEDADHDGLNDLLKLTVDLPLADDEAVNAVQLLLIFDYELREHIKLKMESAAYLTFNSAVAGAEFTVSADLQMRQRSLLPFSGSRTTYDVPVVAAQRDGKAATATGFSMSQILTEYGFRNETTQLANVANVWNTGRARGKPFRIQATIHYPPQIVYYRPDLWYVLKWAWMQYFSLMVLVYMIFRYIRRYVYINQIVPTFVDDPLEDLRKKCK